MKISELSFEEILKNLRSSQNITSIKSNDIIMIGADGAKALAAALANNTILTELGIIYNKIEDDGAEVFAAALKKNLVLTSLSLTYSVE